MSRLFLAVAFAFTCGRAVAQEKPDPNLPPTYGSAKLTAGFLPDPYVKEVQAGGDLRVNIGGVRTHVARAPDFSLTYVPGNGPLIISVKSAGDTTLLVNLPDNSWLA